jgi:hypothetical protein
VVAVVWRRSDPVPLVLSAVQVVVLVWLWLAGRLTPGVLLAVLAGGAALSFISGLVEELWARRRWAPGRTGNGCGD